MKGFADEAVVDLASGKGGKGSASFRREKFVPRGGPDGGDGGRGGSIIFKVQKSLRTLAHLRKKRFYYATSGTPGKGARRHGADGADIVIEVPLGTIIRDMDTREIIVDLTGMDQFIFLRGGNGGKGNWHFRTATRQAPTYAQPGLPGEERQVFIELNLIADVGFVGLPNAGKSSLLDMVTNAHPVIAAYPFTTKIPNLGVLYVKDQDIVLADIPGIIEGASQGAGLGFRFLKHISRTAVLAFLIDLSDPNFESVFHLLCAELEAYSPELMDKKRIVIGSKTDLDPDGVAFEKLKNSLPNEDVYPLSVFARQGLEAISLRFLELVTDDHQEGANPEV